MKNEEDTEAVDSTEEESAESADTTEKGVKLPEEFQKQAHLFIDSCDSKAKIDYVRTCINDKDDELRKEAASKGKKKGKQEGDFATTDAPYDVKY